jgi:SAM-dependent methyltransferase
MTHNHYNEKTETIEITTGQRTRIEEIKAECKTDHPPELTDQQIVTSLLDTWDAVTDGHYTDSDSMSGNGKNRSPPEQILDATTGGRGIWCDGQKENERTLFVDKRERESGFCGQPNRYYQIQPDEVEDFRNLPYSDESFDLVVFDPPHTIRQNGMADLKGHVTKKYGALHAETWQDDIRRGFEELFRVLRPAGTLIFKFADEAADFETVLELAPEPPLFGTRTKQSKQIETRWFVFHKNTSTDGSTGGSDDE